MDIALEIYRWLIYAIAMFYEQKKDDEDFQILLKRPVTKKDAQDRAERYHRRLGKYYQFLEFAYICKQIIVIICAL